MGRIDKAARNVFFGYIGHVLKVLIGFVSRTVFIRMLGATYLGVNGLYTNILSVLSLAELGFGTAMNYSLYKPVAEKDYDKIKSLMYLYKRAYRLIAIVISVIGLALVPFLKHIINEPGNIGTDELTIYYSIFLFNTVTTYFISHKYSLVNAEQKGYIQTNIHSITFFITTTVQIIVLFLYKNFLLYLLTAAIIGVIEKVFVNIYLNRLYPYLQDKNIQKLSESESVTIKKNIKALIYHKIGDISRHQTDDIIISSFINVTTVGIISNYKMIINSINGFIRIIFNSVISSFGNLIATTDRIKQFEVFKVYRFLGFWIYGFASIAFIILINPFIYIWLGEGMLINKFVILIIIIDFYFMGHRIVINNFKTAAGIFDADKYVAIIMSIVNLVVSIILVREIGLIGVYIGTLISGLISNLVKPYIIYSNVFNLSVVEYYKDAFKFIFAIILSLFILTSLVNFIIVEITIGSFIIMMFLVSIVPNAIFYLIFRNRYELKYIRKIIASKLSTKH